MDARSQPTEITSKDQPVECTWPCHTRPPKDGREALARDKGPARGAGGAGRDAG